MSRPGIKFTHFDELSEISLVGSEKALQIGLAIATRVAKGEYHEGYKPSVAVFGYHRVGKSTYAKALTYLLKAKSGCNLLEINCVALTAQARDAEEVKKRLQEARRRHMAPHNKPLVVVLDEFDEICRSRGDPKYNPVYSWTMDFVRREYQTLDRTFLVCITNHPRVLDAGVKSEIANWVYMTVLKSESDLAALLTLKGVAKDKASEVAKILWRAATENNVLLGPGQVTKGIESARQEDPHLNERNSQGIAEAISARTDKIPRDYFDEYEELHRDKIEQFNLLMQVWELDESNA